MAAPDEHLVDEVVRLARGHLGLRLLVLFGSRARGTRRPGPTGTSAGAQVRFRAARDGRVLHAVDEAVFPCFWLAAVSFWCEAGPVIRAGYADVLAGLRR